MAEVAFRPAASEDLAGIYALGAGQYGIETADRYHDGLLAAISRLAMFPQSGPVYPGLRTPIRYLAFRRHHIFYDFDGTTVWIVRILHHAMDASRLV